MGRPRWLGVAAIVVAAAAPALALDVQQHGGGVRRPVGDSDLDMVAGLLRRHLMAAKEKLAAETTEADFCKGQLKEVNTALKRESKIVKEKLEALRVAKKRASAAASNDRERQEKVRDAAHSQVDAEMALDDAARALRADEARAKEREVGLASTQRRSGRAREPAADVDDELREARYELRKAMDGLSRASREHDILHDRCIANAGQEQSYEERTRARREELDALKRAHEMLNACGPTGC
mmetsp:Transcript_41413/g.117193  ORF Transcript_41413/g.117193 Transcript_41413/m.117193 type:complete len:239 (-) Transcript_41413:44-760(-)